MMEGGEKHNWLRLLRTGCCEDFHGSWGLNDEETAKQRYGGRVLEMQVQRVWDGNKLDVFHENKTAIVFQPEWGGEENE